MSKESESKKSNTSNTKKNSKTNSNTKKTTSKVTDTKNKTKTKAKNINEKKNEKMKKVIEEKEIIEIEENEFDEDLEDFYEEDEKNLNENKVAEKKSQVKPIKSSNSKKEEISKEKIKKIEKIAKEKNKAKKSNNTSSKITDFGYFLEEHRNIITSFIAGILITTLIAFIIWPDRIATLKNGTQPVVKIAGKTYTANNLYDQMKDHFAITQLLDAIDNDILTKMYPEDKEMTEEVESSAEYNINLYKQYYNYTEEQFLNASGFSSKDDYLEYLKLENRRKKYENKYVEDNLTDKEIQEYYDKNVYGDINCQHILVEVKSSDDSSSKDSNKLSDEDAKKLAEEIIKKIKDGKSWKDVQKEYKDKITYEDLGYQSWDSELEDSFKNSLKNMDNDSYSTSPVKTSYGYHIIHRIDQKKAPSLKKTKSKIIDNLVEDKINADANLLYKALINLRKEKKIEFSDTDMKEKYDNYIKEYSK